MTISVMLVDDSAVVRGLVTRALSGHAGIEIVASACNGLMALNMLPKHKPDVMILDVEMPEMDGMTALPRLLAAQPELVVIMCSTLTERNASISLKALELGAMDYVAKPTARDASALENFYRELKEKVLVLGGGSKAGGPVARTAPATAAVPSASSPLSAATTVRPVAPLPAKPQSVGSAPAPTPPLPRPGAGVIELLPATNQQVKALAIASSTGGPQALVQVFTGLKGKLNHIPIFITQHMPPTFTTILAEHIFKAGERNCAEGKEGEAVQSGRTYLAPGDYHMVIEKRLPYPLIRLNKGPQVNFCRPAADPMIESLSSIYGQNLLVLVLTGMGSDGMAGARMAVNAGGACIAQDEASSVVWGMPRAVAENKLCQAVLPLNQIADYLVRRCV